MRTPALAALLAGGLIAAPAASLAQDRHGPPPGPPSAVAPGPVGQGGVPPAALDDFHAREAALRARFSDGVKGRTLDYKAANHGMQELHRLDNEEAQWRRRQNGRIYPNQLSGMKARLEEIRAFVDKAPPVHH